MNNLKDLKEKISERIEFLADHWGKDDKKPFNFGGWKEEVIDEIMALFSSHSEALCREAEEKGYNQANEEFLQDLKDEPIYDAIVVASMEAYLEAKLKRLKHISKGVEK